ncbi:MAG: pentapeptide repeat-containing protein [Rhodoplanes sp.]
MDERTSDGTDGGVSGGTAPEASPPSGGEQAPQDFPVPRTGEDGKPIYDQEFFLALAGRGKEVWNRWRAANRSVEGQPYIRVTFEGVDFREPANAVIDFSGFEFGAFANFRGCRFAGAPAAWLGKALGFSGENFCSGMAMFKGATFGECAILSGATFGPYANISGATFEGYANLSGATFGEGANLSGATFKGNAYLSGTTFGEDANLSDTTFGGNADLSDITFRGSVNFKASSQDERGRHRSTEQSTGLEPVLAAPEKFNRARFMGEADFTVSS